MRQRLAATPAPAYFYVYWDAVDAIAHTYGPHTEQYVAELKSFSYLLQTEVLDKLRSRICLSSVPGEEAGLSQDGLS